MTKDSWRDIQDDNVGAKYLKMAISVWFLELFIFVVEVLIKESKKPEVIEVKEKETQNLKKYNTFEEFDDEGQDEIGILGDYK